MCRSGRAQARIRVLGGCHTELRNFRDRSVSFVPGRGLMARPGFCHGSGRRLGRGARPGQTSGRCDGVLPLRCRFASEDPQRRSGDQVALKVEIVVNGGVHDEKYWADPADLKRCILRSRRRTI
jgi:hypothetical protein